VHDTRSYDLEKRLLHYAAGILTVAESVGRSRAGRHVADQLLRSGTSAYGHHGEAEGAESRNDFVHKLRVCYKELRESRRWLWLIEHAALTNDTGRLARTIQECDELVRIFAASIRTAIANGSPALKRAQEPSPR
jgi:four helix bundle protein